MILQPQEIMSQLAQENNSLLQQQEEINRTLWVNEGFTKEFLEKLEFQRRSILDRLETLSVGSGTPDLKLRILAVELKTLSKIIIYARTGRYND